MASPSTTLGMAKPLSPSLAVPQALTRTRLLAIDALRGFVMLLMLVDHVRETFFLHVQVTDPIDALNVDPGLYFTRMTSQLCAPVFVFLTGLSAYLYGQSHTRQETSLFLLKRGLFLIILELTLVNFAWNATFVPKTLWLQVIWCIGLCMIALAALLHLPRLWLAVIGLAIVAGHNLLDTIVVGPESPYFEIWSVLHQRAFIPLTEFTRARTTYPILPWIGVISLGYVIGPWFARTVDPARRIATLCRVGVGVLVAFVFIRYLNVYGEKPWVQTGDTLRTVMSFMSATKYPPSLMFLMPTLGLGLLLLAAFEKLQQHRTMEVLGLYGGAPMFFYLLHLLLLKAMYLIAVAAWGTNQGDYYGFDNLSGIWAWSVLLAIVLFFPSRAFARFKQRRRDLAWLRYL